jgi:hypothetical protein
MAQYRVKQVGEEYYPQLRHSWITSWKYIKAYKYMSPQFYNYEESITEPPTSLEQAWEWIEIYKKHVERPKPKYHYESK